MAPPSFCMHICLRACACAVTGTVATTRACGTDIGNDFGAILKCGEEEEEGELRLGPGDRAEP